MTGARSESVSSVQSAPLSKAFMFLAGVQNFRTQIPGSGFVLSGQVFNTPQYDY